MMPYSHRGLVRAITDNLPPFMVDHVELDPQGHMRHVKVPAGYEVRRAVAEEAASIAERLVKAKGLPP